MWYWTLPEKNVVRSVPYFMLFKFAYHVCGTIVPHDKHWKRFKYEKHAKYRLFVSDHIFLPKSSVKMNFEFHWLKQRGRFICCILLVFDLIASSLNKFDCNFRTNNNCGYENYIGEYPQYIFINFGIDFCEILLNLIYFRKHLHCGFSI